MKLRSLAFPLLALASVVLASACTVGVDGGVGVTIVCVEDSLACDFDDDCCSNVCVAGVCATPVAGCFEDNSACGGDGDCCSGVCASDGYCGYPATVVEVVCSPDNAPCNVPADCCSFLCASDGACGLPADCTVDNDPCIHDSECCSGLCAGDGFCGLP